MKFNYRNYVIISFIIISILYIMPAFFQFNFDKDDRITGFQFAMPRILSGDLPNHLLMLNSFFIDGDFDLKNNYEGVINNESIQAGFNHKGKYLETLYYDSKNNRYLEKKPDNFNSSDIKVFCTHPPGIAVFTGIFIYPAILMHHYELVEPFCIFISIFAMLTGLIYIYKTVYYYTSDEKVSLTTLIIFAFATPLWHYGISWQIESFIAPFMFIAYYYFAVKNKNLVPGILFAVILSMRYPVIVPIAVFACYRIYEKKYREMLLFILPAFLIGLLILIYQNTIYGNPFIVPQGYYFRTFANPLKGIFGSLFDIKQGLLAFAPVLIFSVFGIKHFYKKNLKQAIFILILLVMYSLIYTVRGVNWEGGGYSNRYLVPLIPFLAIFFADFIKNCRNNKMLTVVYIFAGISFLINIQGAFLPALIWGYEPWHPIKLIIVKFSKLKEVLN